MGIITRKSMIRILLAIILSFSGIYNDFCQTPSHTQVKTSKNHWLWEYIKSTDLKLPKDFLFGAGISDAQSEDKRNLTSLSTWSPGSPYALELQVTKQAELDKAWKKQKKEWIKSFYKIHCRKPKQAEIDEFKRQHWTFCFAGKACDSYNRYKDDIKALKAIGCTAYRFSLAWERVMPTENTFDQEALTHYKNVCKELREAGIEPLITLYHYSEPVWFAQKGGFEKEENIKYFVAFCKKLFEELGEYVNLYGTFNAPVGGIAINSYYQGGRPPFKKDGKITATVIKNILDAHVAVYQAKQEVNPELKVGILKNTHQLDPWHKWNPADQLVCKIGNNMQDDPFYQFFTTGQISTFIPLRISHTNKDAPHSLDFVGLNYYGHRHLKTSLKGINKNKKHHEEQRCGTPGNYHKSYTIYPEGIYRALMSMNEKLIKPLRDTTKKHIPIYITENGIGTNDEDQRIEFMQKYLYAISRAVQDGCDVRGYFYWSLLDNYEWGRYSKCYGLCKIDPKTGNRIVKPSASYYMDLIKAYNKASCSESCSAQENNITVTLIDTPPINDTQQDGELEEIAHASC